MDFRIDKNLIWTAIIYFAGSFSLGIPWWKAAVIAAVALICWYLAYGRRIIIGIGLGLLVLGMGNWAGLVPQPSEWGQMHMTAPR